jgi:hypothetical protein
MARATPSLVRSWRLHFSSQPGSLSSGPRLQFFLEPALEAFPARRTLLALGAERRQYRIERLPLGGGTLRACIGGLAHQLRQHAQALGGNLLAPLAESGRQQRAPRRLFQCRQQVRTTPAHPLDPHVDARIEPRAAGIERAQRGVVGLRGGHAAQAQQQHQALQGRAPRRRCSRSFRSSYATMSMASTNGTPKAADHQRQHRGHGGDQEQVGAPEQR